MQQPENSTQLVGSSVTRFQKRGVIESIGQMSGDPWILFEDNSVPVRCSWGSIEFVGAVVDLKQRVPFRIAIAGHGDLIPFEIAILSGEYLTDSKDPITALAIRSRVEDALKIWKQTPEGQGFWHRHGNLPSLDNLSGDLDPELLVYIAEAGILNFQIQPYRIERDWDYYSLIDLD